MLSQKKPSATARLNFEIRYETFAEDSVTEKLTGRIIWLHFIGHDSVVIDATQTLWQSRDMTKRVKNSNIKKGQNTNLSSAMTTWKFPPMATKANTFFDHPSEWTTSSTVTPLERITGTASLQISHSKLTTIDKKQQLKLPTEPNHLTCSERIYRLPSYW